MGTAPSGMDTCGAKPFTVQVLLVNDMLGNPRGCLAVLPYNTLTIFYTPKSGGSKGSLTWTLTDNNASWEQPGVAISSGSTDAKDKTFKDSGTITNQSFTITLRDGPAQKEAGARLEYSHAPMVGYDVPSSNIHFHCLGVDPVIINSEN
jgi:hypothetical protein